MLRKVLGLGVALALGGCVTVKPVALPSGKSGHLITCSESAQCMNKAAEICGGPYEIIQTQSTVAGANGYVGTQLEMAVSCGEATPAAPKP
jgi:hypothetical protein